MSLVVREFEAHGFRSLKHLAYPMSDLDVFVGANGVGKTNLYRALELIQAAAANALPQAIIRDGGLASTLWAGPRPRNKPVVVNLSVGLADAERALGVYRYAVEVGFPPRKDTPGLPPLPLAGAFPDEPWIKTETVTHIGRSRSVQLMERKGPVVSARDHEGWPASIDMDLLASETVLGRLEDPARYPELDAIRRTVLQWRFYHGLRTDPGSPLRRPCPAAATPTLASDGSDLAAVFATLAHIRQDTADLDAAVAKAFPGAQLVLPMPDRMASFGMTFAEFPQRIFEAHELSDGTLRFLALAGALLAYRLPPFIALNEPESSLHPDMMEPLADLVVAAAKRTQIWLVTHSTRLADAIARAGAGKIRTVVKRDGETKIEGLTLWGEFDEDE